MEDIHHSSTYVGDNELDDVGRCTVLLDHSGLYELVQDLRQVITRELKVNSDSCSDF